jgi:2'-5' RNA ligase
MVQSIEMLLDDELDERVRREWDYLAELGLPSQAKHRGASNRPHVTIGVAQSIPDEAERELIEVARGAHPDLRLGGLLVFGGRNVVLARAVVPSTGVLDLHHRTQHALRHADGVPPHLAPEQWTPHVTLAMRMTPDQLASAVRELIPTLSDAVGAVSRIRRWDGDGKREWPIS